MIKAILLDLDDTLLRTNMSTFLPMYFQALGRHMQAFLSADELIPLILQSTAKMMEDSDPEKTNQDVFDSHFFPGLNHDPEEVKTAIRQFYEDEFPKLRQYTNPMPFAVELVDLLVNHGFKLVVATNPLFPRRAIEHRIHWAGLSQVAFDWITTYENSHFCKPNPLYYREILSRLGVQPREAVMIGDDYEKDIIPAKQLEMMTFWVSGQDAKKQPHGDLKDCILWLQSTIIAGSGSGDEKDLPV